MLGQYPAREYLDILNTRVRPYASNRGFHNAITIVPTRKMFRAQNRAKLTDLARETTIYKIACEQSKKIQEKDLDIFGYLEENLYLCEGAQVVINKNINAQKGIFNAAKGKIHEIVFVDFKPEYLIIDLETSKLNEGESYQ